MKKFELGNLKQVIWSGILCGIVLAAMSHPPISNIHLVVTILFGILHICICHQWDKGRLKKQDNAPSSYAYVAAYVVNLLVSFGMGWWFSGIVWTMILTIYIAIQTPKEVKRKEEPAK